MTKQEAITQYCKNCGYDAKGKGTWRKQITDCLSTDCDLYPFRPVNAAEQHKRKLIKLANMNDKELEQYKRKAQRMKSLQNTYFTGKK